jgi:hypothetical protein
MKITAAVTEVQGQTLVVVLVKDHVIGGRSARQEMLAAAQETCGVRARAAGRAPLPHVWAARHRALAPQRLHRAVARARVHGQPSRLARPSANKSGSASTAAGAVIDCAERP